jgi:hypothetical protein
MSRNNERLASRFETASCFITSYSYLIKRDAAKQIAINTILAAAAKQRAML